jgi:hypothetical protein
MNIYFKPLFFSLLPSLFILLVTLISTLDLTALLHLLLSSEGYSIGFRLFLVTLEVVTYIILLRYYSYNESHGPGYKKKFWAWLMDLNQRY